MKGNAVKRNPRGRVAMSHTHRHKRNPLHGITVRFQHQAMLEAIGRKRKRSVKTASDLRSMYRGVRAKRRKLQKIQKASRRANRR